MESSSFSPSSRTDDIKYGVGPRPASSFISA